MLTIHFIRENQERVIAGLNKRNFKDLNLIDQAISYDEKRRKAQAELDSVSAESNKLSEEIGKLMRTGNKEEAENLKKKTSELKEKAETLKADMKTAAEELTNTLLQIPNIPNESVPAGKTAEDNEVFKSWDQPFPTLHENAQPHWELARKFDIIDWELGAKLTGAGFPVYKGKGARLQRALISFFLDEAEKAGYQEIMPPIVVNEDSARGTGQLPDKEGQMYYIQEDDLYLIPTAEVPITNLYRDVILQEQDFPVKMMGYTPCFRREAGSYGAHVRGLNRLHQFDKVEIVRIEHPAQSYNALNEMLDHISGLLNKLELPYRILRLCGGDMGFTSALTFDFEVWSAAQEKWLEVSSASNFETFQSNRLMLRFKSKDNNKKTELAHTLNGSALALPRIMASLMENHQTPDGIIIPEALRKYTGFDMIS